MEANAFSPWLIAQIVLASILAFPVIWFFTVWLISYVGGWRRFAARYRATHPPSGRVWLGQYALVNGARYGNALNLTVNSMGIFMEPVALFRFNHPPLFIPWSDLRNPTAFTFRGRSLLRYDVGYPALGTLSLPVALFEEGEGRVHYPHAKREPA